MTSIVTLNNPLMNSMTYVDLLGILVGLTRMPGEASDVFLDRVTRAGVLRRTPDYVGLMNELAPVPTPFRWTWPVCISHPHVRR
jgi:hypothetical protein